ncbi:ABC transporter permease [Paenibacillus swuensis]|uniref:ABC transporter permease n=1 Tax=Paenibacillus swuensis TaxID=1178515 RepID=A0A172TMV0_9BACL|nr:carbohydrate ABC transporter permease [Paenibacillus swuensis]ANE48409.1 ABC transporter permease [Paenibacillus swuensis]
MIQNKTLSSKMADIAILLILALLALGSVTPIINTLAVSLSDSSKAAAGIVSFWPIGFTLDSYANILSDQKFFDAAWVSVKRVVLGVIVSLSVITLMAFPLSREVRQFPLRNVYMWFCIFTMMFHGGLIPTFLTIRDLGLIDSIWALVLPGAASVFNVVLMVNFFRNLPKEMDESASIDGAGPWYKLFVIYLPLSVPILATIVLFTMVGHWNSFFDGLIYMNKEENYPLQTYVQQLVVQIDPTKEYREEDIELLRSVSQRTVNAAKIFVTLLPIMLVYPFLQRYFMTGIMLGSVKE